MRNVHLQPGVDVQLHPLAVPGDGRRIAQRAILALAPRAEAGLVAVGRDDPGVGADVDLAAVGIDNDGRALLHALDHAARITDGGYAERAGNDGDVALPAGLLQHQAAQARAVVVKQVRRTHAARD